MTDDFQPDYLTITEVMAKLRCSKAKVYDLIKTGELVREHPGGLPRITVASYKAMCEQGRKSEAA